MKKAVKQEQDATPQNPDLQTCGLDELLYKMSQLPELPTWTEEDMGKVLRESEIDLSALLTELSQTDIGKLVRQLSRPIEVENFLQE